MLVIIIKIVFVSTVDNDDLVFEEAYNLITKNPEYKKYNIKFKIIDSKCSKEEFEKYIDFIKESNIVFTKLMGGKTSFSQFDNLYNIVNKYNILFLPLPTLNEVHPDLEEITTVNNEIKLKVIEYLGYEGVENYKNLLLFLANKFGNMPLCYEEPKQMPWQGIYYKNKQFNTVEEYLNYLKNCGIINNSNNSNNSNNNINNKPFIGILFYRNWYIGNNIDYINDLINLIEKKEEYLLQYLVLI